MQSVWVGSPKTVFVDNFADETRKEVEVWPSRGVADLVVNENDAKTSPVSRDRIRTSSSNWSPLFVDVDVDDTSGKIRSNFANVDIMSLNDLLDPKKFI